MEEQGERELQLLLPTNTTQVVHDVPPPRATTSPSVHPQLDLNLSMSIGPRQPPPSKETTTVVSARADMQVLKQQTADQIRLASAEKAYAERVRELAKRELELAEKEFARARLIWERAREEVEKVERMKEIATRRIGSAALEITCHACMQRFHP